jgi:hypothetical protein
MTPRCRSECMLDLRTLRRICGGALMGSVMMAAASASAQAPPSPGNPPPPTATQPDPQPCAEPRQIPKREEDPRSEKREGTTGQAPPLSDQLAEGEGVLCPPKSGDPDIVAPTPDVGKTPVIPPPGTPGGDPRVRPK